MKILVRVFKMKFVGNGWVLKKFCVTVLGLLMLLLTVPLQALDANYRLCFKQYTGLPNAWNPPVIDGVIAGDAGWTDSFRYVFGNGTAIPDVVVQGIKDDNNLYLSFEVNYDTGYNDLDVIVLGFAPDAGDSTDPDNHRRIHIFPVIEGFGADSSGAPREVKYWKDSGSWNTFTPDYPVQSNPPWLVNKIKVTSSGAPTSGNVSWFVEIKIPITQLRWDIDPNGINIPASGVFGFYFNVIRTGTTNEKYWPPTAAAEITGDINLNTPVVDVWGTATRDPSETCSGVYINSNDITTNNTPDSKINLNAGNIFSANVHNTGASAADGIYAEFKIANFGISSFGDWQTVPIGTSNPTAEETISAGGSEIMSTDSWFLTGDQQTEYAANSHQCILVQLNQKNASTNAIFINDSARRNMDFGTASSFSRTAEISAKGYGAPPPGMAKHLFNLRMITRKGMVKKNDLDQYGQALETVRMDRIFDNWGLFANNRSTFNEFNRNVVSQMVLVANAFRRTGRFIIIEGKRFELWDGVGAFGFVLEHEGPVDKWKYDLTGRGLSGNIEDNNYSIQISPEEVATVTTAVKSVFYRFALIVRGGIAYPGGNFSDLYNPGFSFHLGLEYLIGSPFTVEAIFGYHSFKYVRPGAKLNIIQGALNARYYFLTSRFRTFVNSGVGIYSFDPGDTKFGFNAGCGIQYTLSTRFSLEAAYNYHTVSTTGANLNFSTLQGGFRYRF